MYENSFWQDKIRIADRYYKEWEDKFKCNSLEKYYENFQWKRQEGMIAGINPYVVNLVYATIETKLANMLLQSPTFEVIAKPQFSDWDQESAYASALIKQDTINTLIENPNVNFNDNVRLAALDSFFRFAVIEVGYSADWQNPNKAAPRMKSDSVALDGGKDKVLEEFDLPLAEQLYFKWIPARRFRVAIADSPFLKNCAWVGYYSYFYRSLLENTKGVKFGEAYSHLKSSDVYSPEYRGPLSGYASKNPSEEEDHELQYLIRNQEVCKCWTIWDNKNKEKKLIYDTTGEIIWKDLYDYIPLATHRFNYRLKGWYPVPPVFYWLSPQDEINEAREQMRNYRRRFKRKFWYLSGKVDLSELDKLASDTDGEAIKVKEREAIGSIGNPEIGISIEHSLSLGFNDFNFVSGSSQVRENIGSDRETATKSRILSLKEQARENVERQKFDKFVCEAARLGLLTVTERFTLPLWIKYSVDPSESFLGEVNAKGAGYRLIESSSLDDGYDFMVKLNVIDGSELQMQAETQKLITFLGIINQFPQVIMSPVLIREVAYKVGYRNERVIKELQNTALLFMMGQVAGANQAAGNSPDGNNAGMNNGNANKNAVNNAAPNPVDETMQQLFRQV